MDQRAMKINQVLSQISTILPQTETCRTNPKTQLADENTVSESVLTNENHSTSQVSHSLYSCVNVTTVSCEYFIVCTIIHYEALSFQTKSCFSGLNFKDTDSGTK